MDFAFKYAATTARGESVEGTIYASTADYAHFKLKKMGMRPRRVNLAPVMSLQALIGGDFNLRDLARFYRTFGKRFKSGRKVAEGLDEAATFVGDERLRQAVSLVRQYILEGQSIDQAMRAAGFPASDSAAIKSAEHAGKMGDAFLALSEDIERRLELRQAITSLIVVPALMLVIMYIFTYVMLVFVGPRMHKFLKGWITNLDLPAYAATFYRVADWAAENVVVFTVIYLALGAAAFWLATAGPLKALATRIPLAQRIAERSDLAGRWGTFALLYDAGANVVESCRLLAESARLRGVGYWFDNTARLLQAGHGLSQAVERAGFPAYVVVGIRAAESSGDVSGEILELARAFAQDVIELSKRLEQWVNLASLLVSACFVVLAFTLSYYPIISAIRSSM